ncbi:MAG: Rossmann fold nucleotide-binding protein [Myxococcales bacterium]|nr:MAG: Rossmann fold nucleotide-binding protein [Myxococcales bacterium]
MAPDLADELRDRGALIFPNIPDLPFNPYRGDLYTADELYDLLDAGYEGTYDALVYAWHQRTHPTAAGGCSMHDTLAMALHDNSIDDALAEYLAGRRVVGVMGGHAITRGESAYTQTAKLARGLAARGCTVATGGGPGLMEAANLGARCPDDATVEEAVAHLAAVPDFRPSITAWAQRARELDLPDTGLSLGIPTWFYGHEPPNLFSSAAAKYFRNALREDTLLRSCNAGIVVMPGAAGTVQEIFQDACENYYAADGNTAPMVLVGREHWTAELPAWPLLDRLLGDRGVIHLADSPEEALRLLGDEG